MNFYSSISEYYNNIFPLQQAQVGFVKSFLKEIDNPKVLDIGCATGALSNALSPFSNEVVGIDLDKSMLLQAERGQKNTTFKEMNMLDVSKQFAPKFFDTILCFGNTLVHLQSDDEVNNFLNQARSILKPGGKILIQIINYDRIFANSLPGLSTIENDVIKFERLYAYSPSDTHVQFNTVLSIKKNMQVYKNSVPLFALRKHQFANMLSKAGFKNIELFGNYQKAEFNGESTPLIVEASVGA